MKKDSIRNITVTAMFVALTIVLSQIAIPLPFTDVPLSLATLAVFLSGAVLGPARGAAAQGARTHRRIYLGLCCGGAFYRPDHFQGRPAVLGLPRGNGNRACGVLRPGHRLVYDLRPN